MADQKKTLFEFTEGNAPTLTDICLTGEDPAGTKVMRRLTWQTIRNLFMGAPTADGDMIVGNSAGVWSKKTLAQTQVILHPYSLIGGVWHKQLWISGFKPTLTNGCAEVAQYESSTNKLVYDYLAFDKDAIEYAYADCPAPQDYTGGVIYMRPRWFHPAATAFKVSWGLSCVSIADNEAMDVATGTPQYSNDTGGTTYKFYIGPMTSAITISGTVAAGNQWKFRASRKADDGTNDTLDVDAYLRGFDVFYPVA